MSDETITPEDEITPIAAGKIKSTKQSEAKWGTEVMSLGFCVLPSLLFRAQRRLGLNPTQLAVLLQLADFWWDSGRKPFPKKADVAERLSLSKRHFQRYVADLEKAGFVRRIGRTGSHGGKMSNVYDLSGLVDKLKALEPQFREVAEEAKARRKAVAKPGYRPTAKPPGVAG